MFDLFPNKCKTVKVESSRNWESSYKITLDCFLGILAKAGESLNALEILTFLSESPINNYTIGVYQYSFLENKQDA